jgi:putative transposase
MQPLQAALYVHLAWGTWERAPLLVGELERGVQRGIAEACAELKARVIAVGGIEDHIHLLVQLPPVLSVADLARRTEGSSAHLATHQLAPGAFFKWQRGYGSVTISPSHTESVTILLFRAAIPHRYARNRTAMRRIKADSVSYRSGGALHRPAARTPRLRSAHAPAGTVASTRHPAGVVCRSGGGRPQERVPRSCDPAG